VSESCRRCETQIRLKLDTRGLSVTCGQDQGPAIPRLSSQVGKRREIELRMDLADQHCEADSSDDVCSRYLPWSRTTLAIRVQQRSRGSGSAAPIYGLRQQRPTFSTPYSCRRISFPTVTTAEVTVYTSTVSQLRIVTMCAPGFKASSSSWSNAGTGTWRLSRGVGIGPAFDPADYVSYITGTSRYHEPQIWMIFASPNQP